MERSRSLLVLAIQAFAATPMALAAESPAALVQLAAACGANQACLSEYIAERVYFPHVRELKTAGRECAVAFTAAKERDGYGWYLTGAEFLGCVLNADEAFPGSSVTPSAAFEQCLVDAMIEHRPEDKFARLVGKEFFCELERQQGDWVITQLLQKP